MTLCPVHRTSFRFLAIGALALSTLVGGCTEPVAHDRGAVSNVHGTYRSVVFVEPGPADGGVDVLALGGSITLDLRPDGRAEGTVVIPGGNATNYAPGTHRIDVAYTVRGDTVVFGARAMLPFDRLRWTPAARELETFPVPARGRPFQILLAPVASSD